MPRSPRLHWLFSVARVDGKPCNPDWSTPPSIVNSCDQLACSTLVSLPPAPRSKLVRSVRSRPSVLTSPWLRSEEHTSELQSLMRISYAVFCLQKKKQRSTYTYTP